MKAPRVDRREARHYEGYQVADLLERLEGEDIRLKLAVYIGIFAGMRLGDEYVKLKLKKFTEFLHSQFSKAKSAVLITRDGSALLC